MFLVSPLDPCERMLPSSPLPRIRRFVPFVAALCLVEPAAVANAAGYQSPGFQDVTTVQWLQTWANAFGKDELKAMLEEQKVADNEKYAAALK